MGGWAETVAMGNRCLKDYFGTAVTYTDTTSASDTFDAIFDERFEMVTTGADGIEYTMTRPVLTVRLIDFENSTLEERAVVVIGSRTFVVDGVEQLGFQDARLILQER